MIVVFAFALLLFFVGSALAVVFLMARRVGWSNVWQYLLFSIGGRVITHFALSDRHEVERNLIPLIAAGIIMALLPHIMHQRDLERSGMNALLSAHDEEMD